MKNRRISCEVNTNTPLRMWRVLAVVGMLAGIPSSQGFNVGVRGTKCNLDSSKGEVNDPCETLYNAVCMGSHCVCPDGTFEDKALQRCSHRRPGGPQKTGADGRGTVDDLGLPFDYEPKKPGPAPAPPQPKPPQQPQPGSNSNKPSYNPNQPGYNPNQPGYNPNQPGYNPNQPGYNPNQPGYNPNQPGYNPNQPGYNPNQPGYNPNQPDTRDKTRGKGDVPITLPSLPDGREAVAPLPHPQAVEAVPGHREAEQVVATVQNESGNMEQFLSPPQYASPPSPTLASVAEESPPAAVSSLPALHQPGPTHQTLVYSHRDPFFPGMSPSTAQPASSQTIPVQPLTPLPSPSLPQAATPAAGPNRRHTGRAEPPATPQIIEVLTEVRNLRGSLDRVVDQMEVMSTRVNHHMEAMTAMLQVITNSLAEIAAK